MKPKVQRPQNVTVIDQEWSFHWFAPSHLVQLFIFLAIDLTLYVGVFRPLLLGSAGYPQLFSTFTWEGVTSWSQINWGGVVFLVFVVGAAIWANLWALAHLLNRTRVRVEAELIRVHMGPIPVKRTPQPLNRSNVRQFFVSRRDVPVGRAGTRRVHDLMVLTSDGVAQTLVVDLPSYVHARDLESWLEETLGIEDHIVQGEADWG